MLIAPECLGEIGFKSQTELASRWTEIAGLRLHSRGRERANSTPLVLIHGLVISSLYMIPLGDCLAMTHAVHALDLPGFGRSPGPRRALNVVELAEVVIAWLSANRIAKCHLVANSLGCQVAAHVAVKVPNRVSSLVLIGATINPSAHRLAPQFVRLLLDALREPARLWIDWFFDFARAGIPRSFQTTRHMFADHIDRQLPLIQPPTLILRGEKDPTMPERWGKDAAGLIPNARLVTVPAHAHCVHYTAPKIVAAAILAHLEELDGEVPN